MDSFCNKNYLVKFHATSSNFLIAEECRSYEGMLYLCNVNRGRLLSYPKV